MKLSKRHFWNWFERNNTVFLTLPVKSKKEAAYWVNELNTHLRAYFKFFQSSFRKLYLTDVADERKNC